MQRVCRPNRTFRGFQGQIEAGCIGIDDELTALPSGEKARIKGILVGDRESARAYKGQPVTVTLDKEVDVSRGCVLVKDTDLAVYKHLTVSLLWMADDSMTPGGEYIVKLGTKTAIGTVKSIDYAINVNTGEKQAAESLEKNSLALVQIDLAEPIAADRFEHHRTLGELILIDRVTNMTSACGVVKKLSEKSGEFSNRASFQLGNLEARGDIFEEFYYSLECRSVLKYRTVSRTYTVGDELPIKGESYSYPDSFDIIVLRDKAAVTVRDGILTAITVIDEYKYTGYPVINGRGFEALVRSAEDAAEFIDEYEKTDGSSAKFFKKWLKFDTYRKVIFR